MDLLPTIDVSLAIKTKAVEAICGNHGYDGDPSDQPAMLAFYRAHIIKWLKREHQVWMARQAVSALPSEDSYDIGIPED